MNTILFHFYRLMSWLTDFELQIARGTGRNPENVQQLVREHHEYNRLIRLWEVNHGR